MIKIAVCDDQANELDTMKKYLKEYIEKAEEEIEIHSFSHPEQLLSACEKEIFNIYLLDIVMPMISGLEVGSEIRRHDREAQIVFVTSEPQFALQAFNSNPINYLVKPVSKEQLFQTLDLAISRLNPAEEATFSVKTSDGIRVLKKGHIQCCEYVNHSVKFTLYNGEVINSRTITGKFIDYIKELLEETYFIYPHISFLVNMKYITNFEKDVFTLRKDVKVPISAKNYKAVRDIYMDYLLHKEEYL